MTPTTFTLTLTCESFPFNEDLCGEIAALLDKAAESVSDGHTSGILKDSAGYPAGSFSLQQRSYSNPRLVRRGWQVNGR